MAVKFAGKACRLPSQKLLSQHSHHRRTLSTSTAWTTALVHTQNKAETEAPGREVPRARWLGALRPDQATGLAVPQ